MKETLTFKCILTLDKWSHYYAVFVMMKTKQHLYFSDYYKTITHSLLEKWLVLMFLILVSVYNVKRKSYQHSLIIYWTALVFPVKCYRKTSLHFLVVLKHFSSLECRRLTYSWKQLFFVLNISTTQLYPALYVVYKAKQSAI